jgi:hypothetical protein
MTLLQLQHSLNPAIASFFPASDIYILLLQVMLLYCTHRIMSLLFLALKIISCSLLLSLVVSGTCGIRVLLLLSIYFLVLDFEQLLGFFPLIFSCANYKLIPCDSIKKGQWAGFSKYTANKVYITEGGYMSFMLKQKNFTSFAYSRKDEKDANCVKLDVVFLPKNF